MTKNQENIKMSDNDKRRRRLSQDLKMELTENNKLAEIEISKIKKIKLVVRLKKIPEKIPKREVMMFVSSLLKAVKYDDCLFIEIDNSSAEIIFNSLRTLKKKDVYGIVTRELIQMWKLNKSKDMGFCRLLLDENENLENIAQLLKDVYVCEIKVLGTDDDEEYNDNVGFTNDLQADICRQMKCEESSLLGCSAKIYIVPSSISPQRKMLTFKEACRPESLASCIYKEVKKEFKIKENTVDDFRLKIALNITNEPNTPDNTLLRWKHEELHEILLLIIQDYNINFFNDLLDKYKPHSSVLQAIENIIKNKKKNPLNKKSAYDKTDGSDSEVDEDSDSLCGDIDLDDTKFLNDLKAAEIKSREENKSYFLLLFMDALDKEKYRASLFYWNKLNFHIGTALLANYVLKRRMNVENNVSKREKVEKYANLYQRVAIEILESCYHKNREWTSLILKNEISKWKESCITIAIKTNNKEFLQQPACSDVNSQVWFTYRGEDVKSDSLLQTFSRHCISPRFRCGMDMIGYLLFLTAYSVLLLSFLSPKRFHFLEGVVMLYILVFLIKELDQCCSSIFKRSKMCWEYITDPFNIIDQITISISFFAWGLRWVAYIEQDEETWMTASRYLLCFDFILYMIRFLEFFYLNKFLGPILVSIRKMVLTYLNFLIILMLFLVAYSVASESILYPETELRPIAVYNIFRKGFWSMIGEYSLEEITGQEDCTDDPLLYNNYTMKRCPTKDGQYTVPALLCIYALFVQILMVNLLIALFTNAITESENQRDQIWSYQTFHLTMQYSETRVLLPPFLFLFFLLKSKVRNPFKLKISEEEYDHVKEYENFKTQKVIEKTDEYRLGKEISETDNTGIVKNVDCGVREILQMLKKRSQARERVDTENTAGAKIFDNGVQELLQLLKKDRRLSVSSVATQTNDISDNPENIEEHKEDNSSHASSHIRVDDCNIEKHEEMLVSDDDEEEVADETIRLLTDDYMK